MSLPRTRDIPYDDPKYHHGFFDGPNSHRKLWVLVLMGVVCFFLGMYASESNLSNNPASLFGFPKKRWTRDPAREAEVLDPLQKKYAEVIREKEESEKQLQQLKDELIK